MAPECSARSRTLLLATAALIASACDSAPIDGSVLGVPYDSLRGGIVFATRSILGSSGYDLYWVPAPDVRVGTLVSPVQLTSDGGDETQPGVSILGKGIAFAASDGIFVLTGPEGRFKRISDTRDTTFVDLMPAISPNADRVAWVRQDNSRPVANGVGVFETYVMLANIDGSNVRELEPKPGVIQESPVFDPRPDPRVTRVAWSEWVVGTALPSAGPRDYGVFIFDYGASTGGYVCQSQSGFTPGTEDLQVVGRRLPYRCFGQHLDWPIPEQLVLGQDQLRISTQGAAPWTALPTVVQSITSQVEGFPFLDPRGDGFFPPWPLSSHIVPSMGMMVLDGPYQTPIQSSGDAFGIYLAQPDGNSVVRIRIEGFQNDIDNIGTRNFYYSLTTPRLISP